jgi:hypothetical protein
MKQGTAISHPECLLGQRWQMCTDTTPLGFDDTISIMQLHACKGNTTPTLLKSYRNEGNTTSHVITSAGLDNKTHSDFTLRITSYMRHLKRSLSPYDPSLILYQSHGALLLIFSWTKVFTTNAKCT